MAACWLLATSLAITAERRPQLVLDAGGHTAGVTAVLFHPTRSELLSVSYDKTIRIWDMQTTQCVDVLRPARGPGPLGMLFAAAISPDGRLLAVGGHDGHGSDHRLTLIDLRSRSLLHELRGHSNVVLDIEFSPDGRLLASSSADATIRLWNLSTLRATHVLRGHSRRVVDISFSHRGSQIASASLDGSAKIWSTRSGALERTLGEHASGARTVAWDLADQRLAVGCVDHSITFWSERGALQRRVANLGNEIMHVSYTSGDRLFFSTGGPYSIDEGGLMDSRTIRHLTSHKHPNSVLCGQVSRDGELAATGDADGNVDLWRTADGSLLSRFRSRGARAWSVAWQDHGSTIAFGTRSDPRSVNDRGPLETAFDVTSLEYAPLVRERAAGAADGRNWSIQPGDLATLTVRSKDRPDQPARLLQLPGKLDCIRCFASLGRRRAVVGSEFGLRVFDVSTGRVTRKLDGHFGAVWAVGVSPDQRWLLSSGDDQTLRIWSVDRGELALSCFFAGHDWIAWTPQGTFAASPGGERLAGWHVNREGALSDFHAATQFRQSLYRPDLIRTILTGKQSRSPRLALAVDDALPPRITFVEPSSSPFQTGGAPFVVAARVEPRGDHRIRRVRLMLDGRPYQGRKGLHVVGADSTTGDRGGRYRWTVEAPPGEHRLAVHAETDVSSGISQPLIVISPDGEASRPRPNLYVLAIGISDYPGPWRLAYADKDALALEETVSDLAAPLYRNVVTKALVNGQATRSGVLAGLTWLRRQMTPSDVGVVFYSGHGAKDEAGDYYLVPVDADPHELLTTGIAAAQFKSALYAIPGRLLVMLDACHAGSLGGERRKSAPAPDDLYRDLADDELGLLLMCSSLGREYSLESDEHQHSYFTLAVLQAMRGQADFNGDGFVYVSEMEAYVYDQVKLLTGGRQHPVSEKTTAVNAFPIARVNQQEQWTNGRSEESDK